MVHIYTDGSCLGNPGPGGWACILRNSYKIKELSGGSPYTTNNQMELTAVIEGLKALKNAKDVNIYTDSQYVQKAFTDGWIEKWKRNGFKTAKGEPVKNEGLWRQLIPLVNKYKPQFIWVRGHDGFEYNERADQLAVAESRRYQNGTGR